MIQISLEGPHDPVLSSIALLLEPEEGNLQKGCNREFLMGED